MNMDTEITLAKSICTVPASLVVSAIYTLFGNVRTRKTYNTYETCVENVYVKCESSGESVSVQINKVQRGEEQE